MKDRTICIGDIHGCVEEFEELLDKLQYKSETDRLILLGDLLDRGPDSAAVVRKARKMELECLQGNHEYKFLRWFKGNKYLDCAPHYHQLSDEDVTYINNMPCYIKLRNDLWLVHAGVKPGVPLEKQDKHDLLYIRYTDEKRKTISLRKIAKGQVDEAMFWTEFGGFGASIIYGHNVYSYEEPRIDKFDDGTICYGIDTGCCFGGRLSAMIVETGEIVQVQAKKEYFKAGFAE
jgi:bis(5'-nucleosyl)-tetraphosphatase (symmetrical)